MMSDDLVCYRQVGEVKRVPFVRDDDFALRCCYCVKMTVLRFAMDDNVFGYGDGSADVDSCFS